MAAHKYWRVNFQSSVGTTYIEIRECAFLDGSLADLSVGGVAVATSSLDSIRTPDKAFDKNLSTGWYNNALFPAGLGYNHPSPIEPAYVSLDLSSNAGYVPSGTITTSWSDDGLAWSGESPDMSIYSGSLTVGTQVRLVVAGPWTDPIPFNVKLAGPVVVPTGLQQIVTGPLLTGAITVGDFVHGGLGIITGTVKEKNTPANTPLHRRVVLHRHPDGLPIRSTWSDALTGAYSFEGIALGYKYYVVSFDYEQNYRAVIADNLSPT